MIACGRTELVDGVLVFREAVLPDLCKVFEAIDNRWLIKTTKKLGVSAIYMRAIKDSQISAYYDEGKDAFVIEVGDKVANLFPLLTYIDKSRAIVISDEQITVSDLTETKGVSVPTLPGSLGFALDVLEFLAPNVNVALNVSEARELEIIQSQEGMTTVNVHITEASREELKSKVATLRGLLKALQDFYGVTLIKT
ncbi:MAG: hypothetical protein RXQ70_03985 [Sulfolobaceae archaeon]|nr:hypothetical protein [Sulfolobales archaeon]